VRQRILDRELVRFLDHSRAAIEHLKRLQAQILHTEKLASIGRLVGGAAHELNNPITAMLGYSDLLLNTPLTAEQKPMAAKIGQYVRRTKSLVASLISFARQAPAPKAPLDLNTLARTAIKLTEPHWKALDFDIQTRFDVALPKVLGDSNQLLQVCLQLIGNCLHVSSERGGNVLTVSTEHNAGTCVLQIATQALTALGTEQLPVSSPLDPEDALGLSACQGILQEHRGHVLRERREDGSLLLCMELPAVAHASGTAKEATASAMWQSQPYA